MTIPAHDNGTPIPGPSRAQQVHDELRALVGSMGRDFFRFLELVEEVMSAQHYLTMGYSDPAEYFSRSVGYAWYTIRRRLGILDGLRRIEVEAERAEILGQLAAIGVHKASVLAPVLGSEEADWRAMLRQAPFLDEGDLQMLVSAATNAKPRGLAAKKAASGIAEQPFLAKWLRIACSEFREPAVRAEVANVFSAGRLLLGTDSDLGVLLALVQEVKVEWQTQARAEGWAPPFAESGVNVGQREDQGDEREHRVEG